MLQKFEHVFSGGWNQAMCSRLFAFEPVDGEVIKPQPRALAVVFLGDTKKRKSELV